MSELTKEKIYKRELEKVGGEGNNNLERIRSLGPYATVEYVNTLMSGALKRAIVEELPTEDIDTNTIYMVLDSEASQQGNVYNEYLYINNAWELIGTTEVAETVIANPTLAGTEAELTGLQVGDTKYKVGGGGSELGEVITIDSTNFKAYDTYFGTSIGGGLYRVGIIFNNKTTNEKYCIVCNTETNLEEIDWDDPNIFNICMGCVRGGDLVLKEGGSYFTKMGVVCQYTDSSSTTTKIQILN